MLLLRLVSAKVIVTFIIFITNLLINLGVSSLRKDRNVVGCKSP